VNLIEAIKSGKRFRRTSWTNRPWIDADIGRLDMPLDAIIADDWEIELPTVTINRHQFNEAWDDATHHEYDLQKVREKLIKELGL
jgi:hypothetical protein